ncbi:hypothetical protein LLG96_16440, partial [bacterium]|nr:hypothetical protein [bacterium]
VGYTIEDNYLFATSKYKSTIDIKQIPVIIFSENHRSLVNLEKYTISCLKNKVNSSEKNRGAIPRKMGPAPARVIRVTK